MGIEISSAYTFKIFVQFW